MSNNKILLRALPNVEFVHGYPGIPAGPDRPQATIKGTIEIRLGSQAVKAKWVKVELRKIETIPSGSHGEEFIDFVGPSPITLWQAKDEDDTLSSKDFPFTIRVPETIPPSVALERGAGIKYEVVATLCTKGKKGLLRREASTTVSHSVPVVIDKHELHSTWPIYAQAEARHVVSDELTLAVDRTHTCFAPADRLSIMATLKSDKLSPVVLRGFEFSLRETIVYRNGLHSHSKKGAPQIHTSTLGEQKVPVSVTLYGGTLHKAELGCLVPGNHTTSSVNTGRHIDIGYTLNIKALLEKAKPIAMDLPVTITNWPRHVSADMIKRIGTAPNLSLVPAGKPGIPSTPRTPEFRTSQSFGPPRPPPVGALPDIPNGVTRQSAPQSTTLNGPIGSPSRPANTMSPYPPGVKPIQYNVPGQTSQRPPGSTAQPHPYSPGHLAQTMHSSTRPGSTPSEKAGAGQVPALDHRQEGADEFGYNRQTSATSATMPSRPSEKSDYGMIDPTQHSSSISNHRASDAHSRQTSTTSATLPSRPSEKSDYGILDPTQHSSSISNHRASNAHSINSVSGVNGLNNRASQYSQDGDARNNIVSSPTSSTGRRPRAMSRPLKIVNHGDEILEEESPIQTGSSRPFDDASGSDHQSPRLSGPSNSPPLTHSTVSPWPTAEEEKQRLFDRAKAQAEKAQGMVNTSAMAGRLSPTHSPPANGSASFLPRQSSPPLERSGSIERPGTQSSTSSRTAWPTAEDEKRRLWEQAQADVRRVQGLASTPPPPQNAQLSRPYHHRKASAQSSQDSHTKPALGPYGTTSPPTLSAGAALYSHALASMSRPASSFVSITPANPAAPRRTASQSAPSSSPIPVVRSSPTAKPSASLPPSSSNHLTAEQEKDALRYFEAKRAVERRLREEGDLPDNVPNNVPREEPISYDALFPPASSNVDSALASAAPRPSEKEMLRRVHEARDVAAATNLPSSPPPPPPPPPPPSIVPPFTHMSVQGGVVTPPGAQEPLSEKEIMRRAFEARDAALIRSGQAPQPAVLPMQPAPAPAVPSWASGSSSSNEQQTVQLSEKEQVRRAFEARDRALAAQQGTPPPPDYDMPPGPSGSGPPPVLWNTSSNGMPLTAAEEKALLRARYDQEAEELAPSTTSLPGEDIYLSLPAGEKLNRSDSGENYLRRDPTISAGKKRASQMIMPPPLPPPASPPPSPPPPPLMPRPPAEYIEETKLEDMRNSAVPLIDLPNDFSPTLDLGFGSFGQDNDTS